MQHNMLTTAAQAELSTAPDSQTLHPQEHCLGHPSCEPNHAQSDVGLQQLPAVRCAHFTPPPQLSAGSWQALLAAAASW